MQFAAKFELVFIQLIPLMFNNKRWELIYSVIGLVALPQFSNLSSDYSINSFNFQQFSFFSLAGGSTFRSY